MMNPATVHIVRRNPIVRHAAEGRRLEPPMGPQTIKLSRSETGGLFELIEIEVVPGGGPPTHVHPDFDETFYVLEGVLSARIGDEYLELRPGSTAIVPRGVVHAWGNRTQEKVRFLQVTSEGCMEELLEALASRPLLSFEEMTQLAEIHGTTVVGPPL